MPTGKKYKISYDLIVNDKGSQGVNKYDANVKKAKKSTDEFGVSVSKTSTAIGPLTIGLGAAAVAVAGVGLAYHAAWEEGKAFQQSLANLRAIARPTQEEFQALSDQARMLGRETAFSAKEAGDAFTELAKLGFTTNEIIDSSAATLSLAAASGSELAQSATVMASTISQFGLDASESTRVSDVMAESFARSALDMNKFSEAMKFAGPVARSTGVSLEETTAAMAVLANSAISGSNAGTAMRRVMLELSDSTSKASKVIKEQGVPASASFTEKLQALDRANMSAAKRTDMFGLIATTAAGVMIDNSKATDEATKSIDNYTVALQDSGGAAEDMARIQLDTLEGSLKIMDSALSDLKITLFETFEEEGKDAVKEFTTQINLMATVIRENKDELNLMAEALTSVAGGMALVATNAIALGASVPKTVTRIGELGEAAFGGENADKTRAQIKEQNDILQGAIKQIQKYDDAIQETTEDIAEGRIQEGTDIFTQASKGLDIASDKVEEFQKIATSAFTSLYALGDRTINLTQFRELIRLSEAAEKTTGITPAEAAAEPALDTGDSKGPKKSKRFRRGFDKATGAKVADFLGRGRDVEQFQKRRVDAKEKRDREELELQRRHNEDMLALSEELQVMENERTLSGFELQRAQLDMWYTEQQNKFKENQEALTQIQSEYSAQREDIAKMEAFAIGGTLADMFSAFAGFAESMAKGNKKAGIASKAFAIASIGTSTAIGVMKAQELGVPLNVLETAKVLAIGATQLNNVRKQKFSTGRGPQGTSHVDSRDVTVTDDEGIYTPMQAANALWNMSQRRGTGSAGGPVNVEININNPDPRAAARETALAVENIQRKREPSLSPGGF